MTTTFAVTWDYRCPFARNAHEHLVTGLQNGADWDVTFVPFSLDQAHVEEGGTPVFDEPEKFPGLTVNLAGIVVRDRFPDQFLPAHLALFAARHDKSLDVRDPAVVRQALTDAGVDADAVFKEIDAGWPLETARKEHDQSVKDLGVFGVPTFIIGDRAVFVRFLNRPDGDVKVATSTVQRVVDLMVDAPELNEYKFTRIPR